jgi:hypothetical protein
VFDAAGNKVGENTVTAGQGGCVLLERWQSSSGTTGLSMNYFDPQRARWRQHWISPTTILEMSGEVSGQSMILEGPLQYLSPTRTTLLRGTWTLLPDGRVRQHFVESSDDGASWREWFDGYYVRRE